MKATQTLLIALLTTLFAGIGTVAYADTSVTLGGSDRLVLDENYDYLVDDDVNRQRFYGAMMLQVHHEIMDYVSIGAEYQGHRHKGELLSSNFTFDTVGLLVMSRLQFPLDGDTFVPYTTLGLGGQHALLRVSGTETREQTQWVPMGYGALGIEIHVPRRMVRQLLGNARGSTMGEFTAGFIMELGYAYAGELNWDNLQRPEPDKPSEAPDLVDSPGTNLGSVDLSGVMMRFGVQARF